MAAENRIYRVCIISAILPPAYGGAEVAAFKYAMRLNEDPLSEVIVIGWDRTGAYVESNLKYDFVYPVNFSENPRDAKGIFIYFQQVLHMWNCFRTLIKPMYKLRNKYDYIHNFNSGFAFNRVSIFIGKLLGKKVITETSLVGDDDPISLGRFPDWKDYLKPKYIRYLFYKMADSYVSKSSVITEIFERSEIPMKKVTEIPYSVDINKFNPVSEDEERNLRKKLNLWDEGRIVLFVGGINVRKGVHILLEAFISVEKRYPDLKLVIAGPTYKYDKKYISDIKERIEINGLGNKVILTERNIPNVDEYMKCSDIFVLPSRQEGFPISILEAMSCELTVIGSDIPEISKAQIDNGINGYTFRTGDVTELTSVLEKVLDCRSGVALTGKEARKKVISKWSTDIVDRSYRDLYEKLRNKSGGLSVREKIKILYTIPNFNTAGSGKALINVISRLDRDIFEPSICCRHDRGDLFNLAKALEVPIYISEFSAPMKPRMKALENVMRLTRFFRKINPDIIHSYNYSDDYSEVLTAKMSGIKWVYTKKNMSWGSNAWKIRSNLANAIIPQNQEMIEIFFNGIKKYSLIPIGIDLDEFSGLERDESLVEKYGLSGSYPVILSIANIIPIKGIQFLIDGFSLIDEDFDNAKLMIVGEDNTEYANKLKQKVKDMNLENKIIFTGKQFNVKSFFTVADIFILSSMKAGEGGPISVLEAMASGVLSYGSNVPGIKDQFREFQDQLFESENPGSIANKILHAAGLSPEEREKRIKKQREFIKRNYSIENEVMKLEQLYVKVHNSFNSNKLAFEESFKPD